MTIGELKEQVLEGKNITRQQALFLAEADLEELSLAADEIQKYYCGMNFDLCAVVSVKSGRCSENCKYCVQSSCSDVPVKKQEFFSSDEILQKAKLRNRQGICHYGIVASGRRLSDSEVDRLCEGIRKIRQENGIAVCVSGGLLEERHFRQLKKAGAARIHNNLETSRTYFSNICTSHTYEDKITTIRAAKRAGLEVCSGGIIGIGETMEDRIDMAFALRELEVQSVPVNLLHPVPGTPMGEMPVLEEKEVKRIVALFRFILPKAYIRLAAGRDYMSDSGLSCFQAGSNAAITGDMLTVHGVTVEEDLHAIEKMGYEFVLN